MAYYVYERKTEEHVEIGIVLHKKAVPKGAVAMKARDLWLAIDLVHVKRSKLAARGFQPLSDPGLDVPFCQMWGR